MLLTPIPPRHGTPFLSRPSAAADAHGALPPTLLDALREPVILFPAAEYQLARDLLSVPVPALAVECDPEGGVLVHLDGQRVPLPACPPMCLAAVAFTDEGEAAMQDALDTMPGGDAAPAVARIEPGDVMALACTVLGASSGMLRRQAGQLTSTLRSLAQLRAQHDDQQRRLAALEAFVARDNRQDFDCVFAEPPAEDGELALRLGEDANVRSLAQLLPVASRGVSAIGLHLAETPLTPDALVAIRLHSLEDGRERAAWRVPAADLRPGWQVFGLDAAITGLSRTLRLSVEVSSGTIALSLGAEQPLPAFRILGPDGVAVASRSLAFKVWAGLPGVMPPLPQLDHIEGEAGEAQGFEEVPVAADRIDVTRGREVVTLGALADDTLPCDAPEGGTAFARLRGGLPRGAMLLRATGRGRGAEFALGAGDLQEVRARAEAGAPAAPGWSGWIAADAAGLAELRLSCEPGRGAADLHILTRGADGRATPARIGGIAATVVLADAFGQGRPAAPPEAAPAPEPALPEVTAPDFRGTGFHGLEGAGERRWRWLGRQVSLAMQGVPRSAAAIEMSIVATAPGLTAGSIAATVNGMPAAVTMAGSLQDGLVARIAIPPEARRGDRSVTLGLAFGRCHQPPGDGRTLSVACTGIRAAAG
ncbi:DUF6212 domain-containing protein [Falsiroseomonas sp. CW058]|uniref:DUF6212 domain-containing protein n=1 Tax=Falsiroseomonas sp. CW058 TaxID=3388664 RepID=UPI003D3138CE